MPQMQRRARPWNENPQLKARSGDSLWTNMAALSRGGDPAVAPFRDMPRRNTALLIIDMISDMEFRGAAAMLPDAKRAASTILKLRNAADRAKIPVIYVNDNFGEWHSERHRLVERALSNERARDLVAKLAPRDGDFFIIKPQFSGFYATNLPVLLPKLGVDRLVLTGLAADICVMFTAADAHMRDYRLWILGDAVAAETRDRHRAALHIMHESMGAEVGVTAKLTLAAWAKRKSAA